MKLSVVIIAKNEAKMIDDCLASVAWADEVILVDNGSADGTVTIARKHGAKIYKLPTLKPEFAKLRNLGLKKARGEWLLYLDADERLTPKLKEEIKAILARGRSQYTAYEIPRRNFYLGQEMHYGGAWPDYVKRFFFKKALKKWQHQLHEDPVFEGKLGQLKTPMIHLTHRDLSSMIAKTNEWSKIEADLLLAAGHPPMTWWRLVRPMISEFWQRGIIKQGLRDGPVGWIEVIFQVFSRFVTYAKLWELQNK